MTEKGLHGKAEPFSLKKRAKSFRFAFKGIYYMIKTQHNFWVQMCIVVLVIILGIVVEVDLSEWVMLVLAIGLVLAAETFNSALEKLTDIVRSEQDAQAGLVKDIAAGAVLIAAIAAAAVGFLIFAPKIITFL